MHILWEASSRGFLHATPTLRRMVQAHVPAVIHVHATLSPPLQALYDTEAVVLSSEKSNAVSIIRSAHAISTHLRIPVVHIYSGSAKEGAHDASLSVLPDDVPGDEADERSIESILRSVGAAPVLTSREAVEQPSILLLLDAAYAKHLSASSLPSNMSVVLLSQVLPTPVDSLRPLLSDGKHRIVISFQYHPASSNWSPLLVDLLSNAQHKSWLSDDVGLVVLASSTDAENIDDDVLRSLQQLLSRDADFLFEDGPCHSIELASLRSLRGNSPKAFHRALSPLNISPLQAQPTDDRIPAPTPNRMYESLLGQLFDEQKTQIHRTSGELVAGQLAETFGRLITQLRPGMSNWLVAGSELEYDEGLNAIHNIFSNSTQRVKLLIIDDTPLGSLLGTRSRTGRRDVGLYALNYGSVYVASVSLYASYPQTVQALTEAEEFDGSAVVLAYLPVAHQDDEPQVRNDPLLALRHSKQAVDAGAWPLYRFNPRSEPMFELDSKSLRQQLSKFVEREEKFSLLLKQATAAGSTATTSSIASSVDGQVREMHRKLLETSFRSLLQGLGGAVEPRGPALLLFASDGSNATKAARNLADSLKSAGFEPTVKAMDDVSINEVLELTAGGAPLVFSVSTAGQGEFPTNGKVFWAALRGLLANAAERPFDNVRVAIFGLGDSHYWPRPEDAHYFCKPVVDLEDALSRLGAQLLLPVGKGDDQAPDQWRTEYAAWRGELLVALGCASAGGEALASLPPPDVVKAESNFLRGTIAEGLLDESTGALAVKDTLLTKFHGIYQQDDRDLREARRKQGMEPAFSFMIRVRAPGGAVRPDQWLAMDSIADAYGGGQFRLTTRQALQFHGVIKRNLKKTVQDINATLMDTLAACGDVNRNVMCNASSPGHITADVYQQIQTICNSLSDYLTPRTTAYHEIWLDKTPVAGQALHDVEPIYGPTYLPRKFKMSIAIPPSNDVDVYAGDLGFIAIVGGGGNRLEGFNVVAGGGMGMTHNTPSTYPKVAQLMGFCTPDQVLQVAEGVILAQRDNGNRENRRRARLKYTIEEHGGIAWLADEVHQRMGIQLQPIRPFHFNTTGDEFGWKRNALGLQSHCIFIENGRIKDLAGKSHLPIKTGLREVARFAQQTGSQLVFRLTPNQSVIIDNVADEHFAAISQILDVHSLTLNKIARTAARLNSMACVALPTCGLALSESERFLPHLMDLVDQLLQQNGLADVPINIRMSGCPNGCSRPILAEIGLVGRAPNLYNLYLGASHNGDRLSTIFADGITGDQIVAALAPIFERYAAERLPSEHFGDFVLRMKYVTHTNTPVDFHPQLVEI